MSAADQNGTQPFDPYKPKQALCPVIAAEFLQHPFMSAMLT
jgi:hypothetical protein